MHDITAQIPPSSNFANAAALLPTGYPAMGHRDLTRPTPAAGTATASHDHQDHGHRPEAGEHWRTTRKPPGGQWLKPTRLISLPAPKGSLPQGGRGGGRANPTGTTTNTSGPAAGPRSAPPGGQRAGARWSNPAGGSPSRPALCRWTNTTRATTTTPAATRGRAAA